MLEFIDVAINNGSFSIAIGIIYSTLLTKVKEPLILVVGIFLVFMNLLIGFDLFHDSIIAAITAAN